MPPLSVVVVGATGTVGRQIIQLLESSSLTIAHLRLLASTRGAGQHLQWKGESIPVEVLAENSFRGVDLAFFSVGATVSKRYAPLATAAGALVIDNSSAWRNEPEVPLVVPEVNLSAAHRRPKNIIANPNCCVIPLTTALKPLHDTAHIRHIVVSTYQSTSGKGYAATQKLLEQSKPFLEKTDRLIPPSYHPFAFNLLCDWQSNSNNYCEEEIKLIQETKKIFNDPTLGISPTTVRVPVLVGHAISVHVQFHQPLQAVQARPLLQAGEGIVFVDEQSHLRHYLQPIHAAGTNAVYVGRLRDDLAISGALNLWIVSDNLRKGAALNAIQIAEKIGI
ncbi:aspartate-semialdehyde dehydrogenase [Pajaroellobacter abortibovis]|uniref:Aspartate-semialdehyde dehydrogenase n=1 Tax=Pajaroellobacter abortibovis TaxID=1882918 RepID=A0A1L6MYX7_9BACT|nr:aspartate-semialdehyde dehydrogenase [Pajaroellobacter abortibovis]APS00585.1 aspartate-semialdehyde dehydrogenase [Pajaroellobacter abortibovis]